MRRYSYRCGRHYLKLHDNDYDLHLLLTGNSSRHPLWFVWRYSELLVHKVHAPKKAQGTHYVLRLNGRLFLEFYAIHSSYLGSLFLEFHGKHKES